MAFGLCSTSKRVSHVSRGVTGVAYPWQGEYGWLDTPWGNMRTRHLTNEQAPQHKYAHIYICHETHQDPNAQVTSPFATEAY